MVAALMKDRKIDAVVVGADRVVANGDTANKIGTYQLAIVAQHHRVQYYVAVSARRGDSATGPMRCGRALRPCCHGTNTMQRALQRLTIHWLVCRHPKPQSI